MKRTITLATLLLATISYSQSKWAPYASVEENIHISDVRPSYNYLNLSTPAANAGMRLGAFYTRNNIWSAEITLGVVGVGTPGNFSNTIVPVEFVGHYNILDGKDLKFPAKFNIDFGFGSGLAESSNGNFGFAEHAVVGASMEMPNVLPFGTLIMGTRLTGYVDDFIDGRTVAGTSNDASLRFYSAVRFDGANKKAEQAMADAEAMATKVSASLAKAEEESTALEKELKSAKSAHAQEKAALLDEIEALKSQTLETVAVEETPVVKEPKGFYIIVGSYPTKIAAQRFIDEMGPDFTISFVEALNTYRVVHSKHESLSDARSALEDAKKVVENAWIAVY